jgi:hypothetical protein
MKMVDTEMVWCQDILEGRDAELVQALRNRARIAIEERPDQVDEIQYASERGLATHITIIKKRGNNP